MQSIFKYIETKGKRKIGKTTEGCSWLNATPAEIAWAASRTKGTGHTMLVLIYHMTKHRPPYNELGDDHFDKMDRLNFTKTMVKCFERLGYNVPLELIKKERLKFLQVFSSYLIIRIFMLKY